MSEASALAAVRRKSPICLLETWLLRVDEPADGPPLPRFALLPDFVPLVGGSASFAFAAGEIINAELVFYPPRRCGGWSRNGILRLRSMFGLTSRRVWKGL
jgi:hypothetical protein